MSQRSHGTESTSQSSPQESIGPERLTLYFCPACRRTVSGSYGLEAGRKTCSKQWHTAAAKPVHYVRVDVTEEAERKRTPPSTPAPGYESLPPGWRSDRRRAS